MGMLDKLFGEKNDYPPLPTDNEAAANVDEHKLSQPQVQALIGKLSEAYEHASEAPRYSAEVAGKKVTVIPSRGLGKEVHQIIESAIH